MIRTHGNPRLENVYGHEKRLRWIESHLTPGDTVVEFGCGTGYMVTLPLLESGYDVVGLDLDEPSIDLGRRILEERGIDPRRVRCARIEEHVGSADVVIASEVLEHVPDEEMDSVFQAVRGALRPGGRLLITVPNGFGWFELERALWGLGIGRKLEGSWIARKAQSLRRRLTGREPWDEHPSSLSSSPHVQRFTLGRVRRLIESHGFSVDSAKGTVLFAGPLSNLFVGGVQPLMRANAALGTGAHGLAAAFMVSATMDKR